MNNVEKESAFLVRSFLAFCKCVQSGLFGFAIFFTVLLASKYLSNLIGHSESFTIDLSDVLLSLIGFVLAFLISFLGNFSAKRKGTDFNKSEFSKKLH